MNGRLSASYAAAALTAGAARFGVRPVLLASGIVYGLVAAAGLLTPVRQPRPEAVAFPG